MEKTVNKKPKFRTSVGLVVLFVILTLYTISFFIPAYWTVIASFKKYDEYFLAESFWDIFGPTKLSIISYQEAFTNFHVPKGNGTDEGVLMMFVNSILYAGGCAIIGTIIPCVMAYLVARYNYTLGKIVYGIVIVTMAIPIVGSLPSEIRMVDNMGLFNSLLGLYVLKANFLGLYFLVFYAQFKTIPKDYTEAARIDGASEWHVMVGIIFPVAMGTISTVTLLNFINFWNDYQTPMIYWNSSPVISFGMYYADRLSEGFMSYVTVKLAVMMIVAVPVIVLFLIFNKKIMSNMSIGGVKG